MSRHINIHPQAREDLLEISDYLSERNFDAMLRFIETVNDTMNDIAEMPGRGFRREYNNPRVAGLRVLPVPGFEKYLVYYLTTEESIEVLRILHGSQQRDHLFDDETSEEQSEI